MAVKKCRPEQINMISKVVFVGALWHFTEVENHHEKLAPTQPWIHFVHVLVWIFPIGHRRLESHPFGFYAADLAGGGCGADESAGLRFQIAPDRCDLGASGYA
jgi:hypothetical protein